MFYKHRKNGIKVSFYRDFVQSADALSNFIPAVMSRRRGTPTYLVPQNNPKTETRKTEKTKNTKYHLGDNLWNRKHDFINPYS